MLGSNEQEFAVNEQIPGGGSERLSGVSLKVDLPMKLHFRSIEEIVL
jgi:hypothetical protein